MVTAHVIGVVTMVQRPPRRRRPQRCVCLMYDSNSSSSFLSVTPLQLKQGALSTLCNTGPLTNETKTNQAQNQSNAPLVNRL